MESQKIEALWEWFCQYEQIILDFMEKDALEHRPFISENLDNLVLDLGKFSWEIGPGAEAPWYFCISPNEDQEFFLLSQRIMNEAPSLSSWEFYPSKPAKNWDRQLLVYDDLMNEIEIDAREWHFVAQQKPNGKYHIRLEASKLPLMDPETQREAAHKIILYEMGEAFKMTQVSEVEITDQLEDAIQGLKAPIGALRPQLNPAF
ncbi:MAG: hypothetical protein AAFU64_08305 [Bacteroidota bacterium]